MSACLDTAQPTPLDPPVDARTARRKQFERDQLIVDYLNRGVSVAEIAARFDVGEKRMRSTIREILARRMPAPPEEFVAIQVNRLNEALLVAYSAMGGMNLKAVDRVVRIVRELDRYHGFAAAPVRALAKPSEGTATYAPAFVCRARFATENAGMIGFDSCAVEGRPPRDDAAAFASALQTLIREAQAPELPGSAPMEALSSRAPTGSSPGESDFWAIGRLGAPGSPLPRLGARDDAVEAGDSPDSYDRPGFPLQGTENMESAPGDAAAVELNAVASHTRTSISEELSSGERPADSGSPRPAGAGDDGAQAERALADDRPKVSPEVSETINFAPGIGRLDDGAAAPGASGTNTTAPAGFRRMNVRMTLNGVMAC